MQGKTDKQIRDSGRGAFIAICGLIIVMVIYGSIELYKHCEHHYWSNDIPKETNYWIPSEADKLWLDSLYEQVKRTEDDVLELNESVNRIDRKIDEIMLRRIDYPDGSWDSIKVKPSKFKPNKVDGELSSMNREKLPTDE
tara:strand:+ start:1627 stop:2046 length:420 start_codon:yes stop_codon:yes gene_type:complete